MGVIVAKNKVNAVNAILAGSDCVLNRLYKQKQSIDRLNKNIDAYLPAAFRGHIFVMNMQNGILCLGVSNSSLASKLHFQKSDLLSALRKEPSLCGLTRIEHKLASRPAPIETPPHPKPVSTSLNHMIQQALSTTNADCFKKSLRRLLAKLGGKRK